MTWLRGGAGRRIAVGGTVLGLLVALGAATGGVWIYRTLPNHDASYSVADISSDVRIVRDRHAVPHVFASTSRDAYFAMGFVHAQDRLWQMEWQRRLALGRLSEIVGEPALQVDRLARLMRIGALAEAGLPLLSGDVQDALAAYAAGVNAWIERAPALPPEFALLQVRPEPWRAADSLAIMRGQAAQMAYNVRQELLVARAARRLTAAELRDLFPLTEADAHSLVAAQAAADVWRKSDAFLPRSSGGASNVWAVSGRHTSTGRPVLANDPHMAMGIPAVWYLARIEAPSLHVAGATVPGFPFVVLGHNDRIAWGMTSSGMDVQDLFVERIDPADPSRYLSPEGSVPFAVRQERIRIRGQAAEELTVRETRHGPLLSDVGPRAAALADARTALALSYSGNVADDRTAEAIYRINRAGNWPEFREAAKLWAAPPQNLAMAAVDGTIGMTVVGRAPARASGDGRVPRPGWTREFDWNGAVPDSELPGVVDPPGGRIVDANDGTVLTQGGRFLGDPPDDDLRARRIASLLDRAGPQAFDASVAIQSDQFASDASVLLPLLLRAKVSDTRSTAAIAMLVKWDFEMQAERPEPLIYAAWLRSLARKLFAQKLGDVFPDYWDIHPGSLARILAGNGSWCAGAGGDCAAVAGQALSEALADLSRQYGEVIDRWRWGDAHRADFVHPIWSRVPVVSRLTDHRVAVGGGSFTVGRAAVEFARTDAPFAAVYGSMFRAVYDLSDLSRSRFAIATGQSGHPFSRHYSDLIPLWQAGRPFTIAGDDLARDAIATMTLTRRK